MLTKTYTADVKAATDEDGSTTFTGYAAVFGNIDLGGDMVVKGAFAESLKSRYADNGQGIPVYWNHDLDNPFANIGLTSKAVEDDHGLLVTVPVDESTDYGKQVARLLKEGRVTQMSFSFDVKEGAFVETDKDYYYELRALDLFEVSVVPVGMNQATEIVSVKALREQERRKMPGKKSADISDESIASLVDSWGKLETAIKEFGAAAKEAGLDLESSDDTEDDTGSGPTDGSQKKLGEAKRLTAARRLRVLDI